MEGRITDGLTILAAHRASRYFQIEDRIGRL